MSCRTRPPKVRLLSRRQYSDEFKDLFEIYAPMAYGVNYENEWESRVGLGDGYCLDTVVMFAGC